MHYYHIHPYARSAEYRVASELHTYGFRPGDKLLGLLADDSDLDFFEAFGGHFVTDELKEKMEKAGFPELKFVQLDGLYTSPGSKDEKENRNEHSFWKVEFPSSGEPRDFFLWDKRFLVVSYRALKFLMLNNGYEDQIGGLNYGAEFTVVHNRFYIPDENFSEYFNNQYPIEAAKVAEREKKNLNEYRRREGLPPLP